MYRHTDFHFHSTTTLLSSCKDLGGWEMKADLIINLQKM